VKVIWTPEAEQDRADIWDYIEADNHGATVAWTRFSAKPPPFRVGPYL